MAKRRLTEQQKSRIETVQSERVGEEGLIIARWGRSCIIETLSGEQHPAKFRTNLPAMVVGDRIIWQQEREDTVVTHLLERSNLIIRPSSHGEAKPVAANVDQLLLVIAPQPEPTTLLIDHYLVHAQALNIPIQILLNKSDLYHESLQTTLAIYGTLGYAITTISTLDRNCVPVVEQLLANKTSILLGQSGVGKSSLMQALLPDIAIRVGALSERLQGQHTTTTSVLYHVGTGSLIDTPGVNDFATWHLSKNQIAQGFIEIDALSKHCHFRNCTHAHEPQCAVKAALETGNIHPSRYQNFLTMLQEK